MEKVNQLLSGIIFIPPENIKKTMVFLRKKKLHFAAVNLVFSSEWVVKRMSFYNIL